MTDRKLFAVEMRESARERLRFTRKALESSRETCGTDRAEMFEAMLRARIEFEAAAVDAARSW